MSFRKKLLAILFLIPFMVSAQDSLRKSIIKATLADHAEIWKSTLRFSEYDYKTLIPVAAATVAAIKYDEQISREFIYFRELSNLNKISSTITDMGDPYFISGATVLMYGSGWLFDDSKLKQTAVLMAEAYFHNAVITYLGKWLFARQRPYVNGESKWHFFPYSLQGHPPSASAYQAFPSGHTSGIFAVATVIAKQYDHSSWIPVSMYTLAAITGLSRITEEKHWLSDVIVGAALGYGIGNFVARKHRNSSFSIFPTYWDNSIHLSMSLEF